MATDEMSGCPVTGHSEVTSSVVNRTRVQPSGAGKHSTWSTGPRAGRPSRVRSSAGEDAGTLTRVSTTRRPASLVLAAGSCALTPDPAARTNAPAAGRRADGRGDHDRGQPRG